MNILKQSDYVEYVIAKLSKQGKISVQTSSDLWYRALFKYNCLYIFCFIKTFLIFDVT